MKLAEHLSHPVVLTEDERDVVEQLVKTIDESDMVPSLVTADGQEIQLPESVLSVLSESARALTSGEGVVVLPIRSELSPQQAARILNVSRPYLTRLLDQGEIPFHRVGSHRRIILSDLLAYKERRDAVRREELRQLSEVSREMGIPE